MGEPRARLFLTVLGGESLAERALRWPCPACGAVPGVRCRTRTLRVAGYPHATRLALSSERLYPVPEEADRDR